MYLGPDVRTIGLRYLRNAFSLLPVAQAELASQPREFADSAAFGNGYRPSVDDIQCKLYILRGGT